jgi:hypothetical protein
VARSFAAVTLPVTVWSQIQSLNLALTVMAMVGAGYGADTPKHIVSRVTAPPALETAKDNLWRPGSVRLLHGLTLISSAQSIVTGGLLGIAPRPTNLMGGRDYA